MFEKPHNLSDYELEREIKALDSCYRQIMLDENVSPCIKHELLEHAQAVEAEYSYRRNEEWCYPLYNVGIW